MTHKKNSFLNEGGDTMYEYAGYKFKSEDGHTVVYDEYGNRVADAESIDEAIRDMKEDGLI